MGRRAEEAVAFTELAVLVAAAHQKSAPETERRNVEGYGAERVIGVDEERHPASCGTGRERVETSRDTSGVEEDGRDDDEGGTVIGGGQEPLTHRLGGERRDSNELDPLLSEPFELPAHRVKLAIGRDDPWALAEGEGGEETDEKLVGVRAEGDVTVWPPEPRAKRLTDPLGSFEGAAPLVVDVFGCVVPGLELPLASDVGPGLVRMTGQEDALRDAESRVVGGERFG
jgi:hypothetical protein